MEYTKKLRLAMPSNQVDEADLMALMEDGETKTEPPAVCNCTEKCEAGKVNMSCPVCSTNMTACENERRIFKCS